MGCAKLSSWELSCAEGAERPADKVAAMVMVFRTTYGVNSGSLT